MEITWDQRATPLVQEVIDNYMSSQPSKGMADGDDVEDNSDEDQDAKQDFAEFQQWLDAGSPAKPVPAIPKSAMPPPLAPSVSGCKCFKNPCIYGKI